jgi:hypothetical protein
VRTERSVIWVYVISPSVILGGGGGRGLTVA